MNSTVESLGQVADTYFKTDTSVVVSRIVLYLFLSVGWSFTKELLPSLNLQKQFL